MTDWEMALGVLGSCVYDIETGWTNDICNLVSVHVFYLLFLSV